MSTRICEVCFACEGQGFMGTTPHFAAGILNYDEKNVCPVCDGRGWITVRNPF